ncbi:MAG: sensor histidine kinase, partial [Stenotrophomonas sp.]
MTVTVTSALVTAPLPPHPVLLALFERIKEGVLLFREDGSVALANAAVSEILGQAERDAALTPAQWLRQLLPPDALEQARLNGHWNGSLPVDERMVIAHVYHHDDGGQRHYLALFRRIEGQEDYERELQQRHAELRQAYLRLNGTQEKLLQSEKMASIGQLAAGVAHEINNPIGYVHSNLGSLQEYLRSLFTVIEAYERALRAPDP